MNSKTTEDLIDSYTEEIRKKFPLRYALCFVLGVSLYWGACNGTYKSALLGMLTLNLSDAISGDKSLFDVPNYIYAIVFVSTFFLFEITQKITAKYISYVANLPTIRDRLEKLINYRASDESEAKPKIDSGTFEVLTKDFNIAREKVEKLASNSQTLFVSGFAFIGSSYHGNGLDLSVGSVLVIVGLIGLHKSCKVFIQDLLPRRAEIKRIFLVLTKKHTFEIDGSGKDHSVPPVT